MFKAKLHSAGSLLLLVACGVWFASSRAPAQSGSRGSGARGSDSRQAGRTHDQFLTLFWKYLTQGQNAYRNWGAFPGKTTDLYDGQSPHGAKLRMYVNSVVKSNPKSPPHGSIIVKENYDKTGAKLMAVTVMYRAKMPSGAGYDPKNNDWYYVKYQPNGAVARTPADKGNRLIAGRFASCIECHSGAAGDDYVFANDN